MSLVQVKNLRKAYGGRLILNVPQLDLDRGKSYLLTGSNGAGKTTLLKILAGLEDAEIAEFRFEGKLVPPDEICTWLAPRMVYLHQHPYLFSTSVPANIAYGLKAHGVEKGKLLEMVKEAMAWAGVEHLAQIPPRRLSGGEKQRVALARARALNPDVLLLDEPTANLDEEACRQVAKLIRQMCDNNHCVVIATHDSELMGLGSAIRMRLERAGLSIAS